MLNKNGNEIFHLKFLRKVSVFILAASLLVFTFCSYFLFTNSQKLIEAGNNRHQSYILADQLRQSSDDLTRMVRTFAATGNERFQKQFYSVLAIRNGKEPRPLNYDKIYWDFFGTKDEGQRQEGPAIPLRQLMIQQGYTPDELGLLEKAQRQSDDLVTLEEISMRAMNNAATPEDKRYYRPGESNRDLALRLLHGPEYHAAKEAIMAPLHKFFLLLQHRTNDTFNRYAELSEKTQFFALISFISTALSALIFVVVNKKISDTTLTDIEKLQIAEKETSKAKERFQDFAEAASDWFWETDPQHHFSYISERLEDIIGVPAESLIGKKRGEFAQDLEAPKWIAFNENLDQHLDFTNFQYAIKNIHGGVTHCSINGRPVFSSKGKFLGYRGTGRDITEEINKVAEQEKMANELQQAQKMEAVGHLAGGIAHEINTPTQYLGDNVEFIAETWEDLSQLLEKYNELETILKDAPEAQTILEELNEIKKSIDFQNMEADIEQSFKDALGGIEQISSIVKAMKTFSHPGQKEKVFADINQALQSTAIICKNEWKYVADISFKLSPTLPHPKCMISELNQVFLNLIVNAAHAIEEGHRGHNKSLPGQIIVATEQVENLVKISISDNGCGIPQDIQKKIFNPFFTTKTVGKGTGQGLSICHDIIVNKHQGRFRVESIEGQGAAFFIEIPIE